VAQESQREVSDDLLAKFECEALTASQTAFALWCVALALSYCTFVLLF
jgi:hypothetical protein